MEKPILVLALGMFASLVSSSCGGSSGGTCANTPACGGNLVGGWTIQSSCVSVSASMFNDSCPTATVTASNFRLTGSGAYKADLTYTSTTSASGTATVHFPASCLTSGGITVTCDQLNQLYAVTPTPGVTLHCVGTADCTCTETLTNSTSTDSGTYTTTAAGVLTETASDGSINVSDYCVKGSTLTLSPQAGSSMMGQFVSGTITLTKS